MIFTLAECCAGIQAPGTTLNDPRRTLSDAIGTLRPQR